MILCWSVPSDNHTLLYSTPAIMRKRKGIILMTTSSTVLLPLGGQRVLVIIAHPDDAESFCGGTMACLAAEGRDIHYLVITRGDKGSDDPTMTSERLSPIREEEQRYAFAEAFHYYGL